VSKECTYVETFGSKDTNQLLINMLKHNIKTGE